MSRHIEDAAELYALGALEPDEAAQVEAHLASGCDDCARRVGRAERMVAEMEAAHVPQVAPPPELG
ncbi:MAG: anti-sigma factor, partial [Vulcanimicrobiaceae bacterium]